VALLNGLLFLAFAFFMKVGMSLIGVRMRWLGLLATAATTVLVLAGLAILSPERWPRILLFSLVAAVLCAREAWSLRRKEEGTRYPQGQEILSRVFAVTALCFALRAALSLVSGLLPSLGFDTARLDVASLILTLLLLVIYNLSLLVVLMSRLESEVNAKVFELASSRNELQLLNDAFAETAGSVDLSELAPRILGLLQNRLQVAAAALYLLENEGRELAMVAQRGLTPEAMEALMHRHRDVGTTWASIEGLKASTKLVADYPESPMRTALIVLGIAVVGSFPVIARGEAIGTLTVGYRREAELDDTRISFLETLAIQLGSIVRAAGLHDELDRANARLSALASTDTLTGLANRRAAVRALERELARARRGCGRVAVIMCDIDHFKAFNDLHGHDCGDYVLSNTASIIADSIRGSDLAARWGGEEFLVILGEGETAGVSVLAERIRKRVESAIWDYEGKRLSVTITLGIGVSEFDAGTDAVIALADAALYEGKRGGRNQVRICVSENLTAEAGARIPGASGPVDSAPGTCAEIVVPSTGDEDEILDLLPIEE